MLSDILPTGFEIGVRYGRVKPGDVVAVVGAGPVGLAAIMTAGLYGAARVIAIDLDDNRLELAKQFGATARASTRRAADWKEQVLAMTDGSASTSRSRRSACRRPSTCAPSSCAPAAHVANVGVHGKPVELEAAGPVDQGHHHHHGPGQHHDARRCCSSSSRSSKLPAEKFVTHRFALDEIIEAYETFGRAPRRPTPSRWSSAARWRLTSSRVTGRAQGGARCSWSSSHDKPTRSPPVSTRDLDSPAAAAVRAAAVRLRARGRWQHRTVRVAGRHRAAGGVRPGTPALEHRAHGGRRRGGSGRARLRRYRLGGP